VSDDVGAVVMTHSTTTTTATAASATHAVITAAITTPADRTMAPLLAAIPLDEITLVKRMEGNSHRGHKGRRNEVIDSQHQKEGK